MPRFLILFENAVGFSLFDCKGVNEIAVSEKSVQQSFLKFSLFSQQVRLLSFRPFPGAEVALQSLNMLTEGQIPEFLAEFLIDVLPSQTKKHKDGIIL
jgi:hypothetical protein